MKKIILLTLLTLPVAFSSCLGDPEEPTNTAQLSAEMIQIKTDAAGNTAINTANYRFDLDLTASLISISTYDRDIYGGPITLQNLPLTYTDTYGYTFHAAGVTPIDANSGTAVESLNITNFFGEYGSTTLDLRYTVNGTNIIAIPSSTSYMYNTVSTTNSNGEVYTYDDSSLAVAYHVVNADTVTVDMALANIKFVNEMPVIKSMIFPGIKVSPSVTGNHLELRADSIIPEISNTPYPDYKITKFSGTMSPAFSEYNYFRGENITGTFKCMGMDVKFTARIYDPGN